MKRNEAFCPLKPNVFAIFFIYICLIKAVIIVRKFIKKPALFLWLEGATFQWVVVG